MSKKQGNLLLALLIGVFLLLVIGLTTLLVLYFGAVSRQKQLEADFAEEKELLQVQIDNLQVQLEAAVQAQAEAEAAAQAARQETGETAEALEAAQAEIAALEEAAILDVGGLDAGDIVNAAQLNLQEPALYFKSYEIVAGDAVYSRIYGKSYVDNPNIGLDDLRYLKVLHYNFDHEIQVGELIVNAELEQDYLEIFCDLFRNEYEIYSMYLIDEFWTGEGNDSDTASCDANNTSAFCYRAITGGGQLSNHAFGRAIDINPQQNPYVNYSYGYPIWYHENANDYIARDTGYAHVITQDDLCYRLFIEHGFSWGGEWDNIKDYQHFEKEN